MFNGDSNDYNNNFIFILFIITMILLLCVSFQNVFASENTNNNFSDINTLTQFTTLNDILNDTALSDSRDSIVRFVENKKDYSQKYIINYYNTPDGGASSMNRSLDFLGIPSDVKIDFKQENGKLILTFSSNNPEAGFFVRNNRNIVGFDNYYYIKSLPQQQFIYDNFRNVFDITYYSNFNNTLPNFFIDQTFREVDFMNTFSSSMKSVMPTIVFLFSLFIILYLFCKKFLGINMDYRGGGGKW